MRLLYVDTSALFKRYVEEDESEAVVERMQDAPTAGTAQITRVEVAAALARAVREQRMARDEAHDAEREFLDDWSDLARIGVTQALTERAAGLAWRHDLRGYDAVQLAAALEWREFAAVADDEIVFACFDNQLRAAAAAEGLATWPE